MKRLLIALGIIVCLGLIWFYTSSRSGPLISRSGEDTSKIENEGGLEDDKNIHPLQIEEMRKKEYPGSDLVIEQTLDLGVNYNRYIASYKSEGLKIYALLTVPFGDPPEGGWPVIIFNHGFIQPSEYRTTERYIAYVDGFASNGYVVLRSDYRGHGNSEGAATGGYGSPDYTIDVLNGLSSVKKYPGVNPKKIGMWGHSMGGHITIRSMVITPDIKAGVIWAGVVASYPDLVNNWRRNTTSPTRAPASGARRWRQVLIDEFGEPKNGSPFWDSISANAYLKDISGPLQLHHGTADHSVPWEFSRDLEKQMKDVKCDVELYLYEGDEHDIPYNFGTAIQRSIEFFDRYLKK